MMGKKALLVVSFGTSTPEVIERCIVPVEKALCEAAIDYDLYRAFTYRHYSQEAEKRI